MGEGGRCVREVSLLEFQQWIGAKIPPEDEEGYSQTVEAKKKRKYRAKLKEKKDYEELLRQMRERHKKS